jgi:hypothetical protein
VNKELLGARISCPDLKAKTNSNTQGFRQSIDGRLFIRHLSHIEEIAEIKSGDERSQTSLVCRR